MPPASALPVLLTVLVGGAFSFYQAGSRLFACGRDLAGWEIYAWLAFAGVQGLLLLVSTRTEPARTAYRWSQAAMVPVIFVAAAQLAIAHPRTFVMLGLGAALYWLAVGAIRHVAGAPSPAERPSPLGVLAETTVFLLAAAVIHSVLAFIVLHAPGRVLDDRTFLAIAVASAGVAGVLVRRERACLGPLDMTDLPPLAILVLVLLRAKLPDGAYDSLFYKATLPIFLADWRTALTGLFDHTLLGTNLLEIVNAQARIVDRDFSPALTTTLAMAALWPLAPLAARAVAPASLGDRRPLAIAACTLLLASLSELMIAAGTAYHEPMLALLMAASLLPMAGAWLFLGAAVAGKVTVVFAVPVLVFLKAWSWLSANRPDVSAPAGRAPAEALRGALAYVRHLATARPIATALCLALAVLAVGEQVDRNLAQTGRLLGVTDVLSGWTDPGNKVLARDDRFPLFDAVMPRPASKKYGETFVHVLTLDRWIELDTLGFHVLPTSRLLAIAAVLALLAPLLPALRRQPPALALALLWLACTAATLNFFSQGRHLFALSFAAAFVVPWVFAAALRDVAPARASGVSLAACFVLAFAAAGDQVVGAFINGGWECRRPLAAPVEPNNFDRPETPLEKRLAQYAAQYRAVHPPRSGVAPTVLCETSVGRKRYLGTHYVYAHASFLLLERRLAASPELAAGLPAGMLAICFQTEGFLRDALPEDQRRFFTEVPAVEEPGVGHVRILVSDVLLKGVAASSLVNARGAVPTAAWMAPGAPVADFVAGWASGRPTNLAPIDTPSRTGAFVMPVEGRPAGVLISAYGLVFDPVRFDRGAHLEIEVAMPHAGTDGMSLEFEFAIPRGIRRTERIDLPPNPRAATSPAWARHRIAVPEGVLGSGSLTVRATSPSGNYDGDWAFVREMRIAAPGR